MSGASSAALLSDLRARLEAEARGEPFVVLRDRDGAQQLVALASDGSTTVGRKATCRIVLDWDDQVSRLHARVQRGQEGWEVIDEGARNGTYVNDEPIDRRRRLHDRDRIRFGRTTAVVHLPERRPAAPAPTDASLSSTQRRVLVALARPYLKAVANPLPATDEEVAEEILLPVPTVRAHVLVLCAKLQIDGEGSRARERLIERAVGAGLLAERDLGSC